MKKLYRMKRIIKATEFETKLYSKKSNKYCLCIFTLNEFGRLQSQLAKLEHIKQKIDIIIVDGGSTDGTVDDSNIPTDLIKSVLIKHSSRGLGDQMQIAFRFAIEQDYKGVVTVDGNDKDDISEALHRFINALDDGFDHIQGSRFINGGKHKNTPLLRIFGLKYIHAPLISKAASFKYTDTTNGFRAYSKKLLTDGRFQIFRPQLKGYQLHYYMAIESIRRGMKATEVPVTRVYPPSKKVPTKISFFYGNANIFYELIKTCLGYYRPS